MYTCLCREDQAVMVGQELLLCLVNKSRRTFSCQKLGGNKRGRLLCRNPASCGVAQSIFGCRVLWEAGCSATPTFLGAGKLRPAGTSSQNLVWMVTSVVAALGLYSAVPRIFSSNQKGLRVQSECFGLCNKHGMPRLTLMGDTAH